MKKKLISVSLAVVMLAAASVIIFLTCFQKPDIGMTITAFEKSDVLMNNLVSDITTFAEIAPSYKIEKDDYNSIFLFSDNWAVYRSNLTVTNNSKESIVIEGFSFTKSADKSYYVRTSDGSQTGIEPGSSADLELEMLVCTSKINSNKIEQTASNANINILYFTVEDILGDYPENPEYKKISVKDASDV